jgi:Uma2 family endonuclease
MGTATRVSEQEYLTTSYKPECEFDNGELQARNSGERPHSILQVEFSGFFRELRKQYRTVRVFTEQRIRIAPRKYRIPDVCVYKEPAPRASIFSTPPFIVIEILSPEDRMSRVRQKIDEYLAFGVPYVWVIDPIARRADVYTPSGIYEAKDLLRTEDPAIEVPLAELFRALDE